MVRRTPRLTERDRMRAVAWSAPVITEIRERLDAETDALARYAALRSLLELLREDVEDARHQALHEQEAS